MTTVSEQEMNAATVSTEPLVAASKLENPYWLPDSFLANAGIGAACGAALALVFWIGTWIFKISAGSGDMLLLVVNLILASFTVVTVVNKEQETHINRSRMLAGLSALLAMLLGYAFWAHRVIVFLDFPHDPERDLALEQFKKIGLSVWFPTIIGISAFGFYYVVEQLKLLKYCSVNTDKGTITVPSTSTVPTTITVPDTSTVPTKPPKKSIPPPTDDHV